LPSANTDRGEGFPSKKIVGEPRIPSLENEEERKGAINAGISPDMGRKNTTQQGKKNGGLMKGTEGRRYSCL